MLTSVKTSRRQGQSREGWSEGSLSAKRRADKQQPDEQRARPGTRLTGRDYRNADKSRVVRSQELAFLGWCFRGTKIVWSDKALHRFNHRVRQLTGRSWGVSMEYRYQELSHYVVGWLNYFALSQYYRPVPALDEWLRRRLRTCDWKQWRWTRTKICHLVALGVRLKQAIIAGVSSNGPYRLSRTKVTQMAMSNAWLKEQGLLSIKAQWSRFHHPASTAWCGPAC